MARLPDSVRARTTVAATAVVALALVAVGAAVVAVLRANLVGQAELRAEVSARAVASRISSGTPYDKLDLPDDEPVQVVSGQGAVLAASSSIDGRPPMASFNRPAAPPVRQGGDDDDDDRPRDDRGERDDDGGHHRGRGGRDDREDDDSATPPPRGTVAPDTRHGTVELVTEEGKTAAPFRVAAVQAAAPSGEVVTVYAAAPLSGERQAVGDVIRAMLIGLPLLLAVVAAVTWLVTRRALRPVEAIRSELAAIAVGEGDRPAGDLARRVPEPRSRDEVSRLARTTNETLAVLEASVERQRRFVADASHELRSPIASLRTQLEVASAHPSLLEIEGLLADVVRLQDLAADLLLLARLDAGDSVPGATVDLAGMVREEVAERAPSDRVPVTVRIDEELSAPVHGSRSRLRRVLANLLDNAQRHAESAVVAELRRDGEMLVLTVADDGPGVPPGQRERIFERFVRLDDARSRDEGGAGLGLAIAREITAMHGGTLTVGDAPEGGALFEVRLPLRPDPPRDAPAAKGVRRAGARQRGSAPPGGRPASPGTSGR